jgi:rhodanese-related sulfurtransferase
MKELNRTRRLLIFTSLFVLVIIIGLLTFKTPQPGFKLSPAEALAEAMSLSDEYFPEDIPMLVEYEDPAYQLVDVRNPDEYMKGHIETAINIPTYSILDRNHESFFRKMEEDSVTVILYGKDQLEANSPWLLLKQLGYNNIKVLLGGYDYYINGPVDLYDMPETPLYLVEEPKYDFAAIIENAGMDQNAGKSAQEPEIVIPTRKKKKNVAEGGC